MKICKECGQEIPLQKALVKIKECNIEVQAECALKKILIKDIKIPKGMRLLTLSEWLVCYNRYRDKFVDLNEKSDEVVQQPIDDYKEKYPYCNVWIHGGDRLDVGGYGWSDNLSGFAFGVRFCRDFSSEVMVIAKNSDLEVNSYVNRYLRTYNERSKPNENHKNI